MIKRIDKIIQSKTAPESNNVLWDDGKNLKINRNGNWENTGNPIDPVVWKYMCSPCIVKHGNKVPEELIGDFDEEEGVYHLKYPNLAMYKIMFTDNRIDTEFDGSASVIITPSDINEYGLDIQNIYISKDYGVHAGFIHIDENKKWYSE